MNTEEKEILDSETQDDSGADVVEETASETEVEQGDNESNEDYKQRLEQERQKFEDQRARAEKAESKLKELKAQLEDKPEPKSEDKDEKPSTGLSKEETILYAKGYSDEEVEKAKSIANIEGVNPLVAAESDYFQIWKQKEDEKKEAQETQLGASRGSVKTKPQKSFGDNLSKDEHRELWKKSLGR